MVISALELSRLQERDVEMANGQNAPHAQAAEEALALHKGMPDDPAKYGVEGCCYRTFWAVVETDGTFVRGRNVARVAHLAPGQYEIVFTSDVARDRPNSRFGKQGLSVPIAEQPGSWPPLCR